jgi:hypothetical protein
MRKSMTLGKSSLSLGLLGETLVLLSLLDGGADRNRTCDLLIANEIIFSDFV